MAVVFAVGAAFVGGLIVYDNLSDSSYSDYSTYDDYDDAEVRRIKRIETLKRDIELEMETYSDYKRYTVNPELESDSLKRETAMKVSFVALDKDAKGKIQKQIDAQVETKARTLQQELKEVDELLLKIDKIERENRK